MPIQQNQFDQWALELVQEADDITLEALQEMRRITNRWVDDPELRFDDRWDAFTQDNVSRWQDNAPEIMTGILITAYIRGINVTDRELRLIVDSVNPPDNPVSLTQRFSTGRGDPTQAAARKLSDYPKHLQAFGALQNDALGRIDNTFPSVLRSHQDIFRQVQSEVLTPAFQSGERVTRLDLGQRMMDRFAQNGITGIRYQNGAQIPIDVYSRMAARSAGQNAALQASANRLNERGYDLVRVNQYAGASNLCAPWQGGVYSLSGTSGQYPSLDSATFNGSTGLFHPNSYIKDMETYTKQGWKLIKDLDGSEKVLSLNPETHIPEWVGIAKLHEHESEKMIHLTSNSFDLCVTPDHDLYLGYSGREKGVKGRVTKYKFEKAEKAIERSKFTQLRCVNWEGESQKVPISGIRNKAFAKLLAWYISDGYCDSHYVRISKVKEPHRTILSKTLLKVGFKFDSKGFICYNKEWVEYFKQFGKSHEKFLPEWIMNERQEIIKVFLDAYVIGDGHIKEKEYKGHNTKSVTYFTTSTRLAEQLGELIIKGGYYPSFHIQGTKGVEVEHHNGTYAGNHDVCRISRNNIKESYFNGSPSTKHRGIQAEVIDYNDTAYCITLERNHVMWVRRNGKTTWSGNCGHSYSAYIPGASESIGELSDSEAEQEILNEMGEAEGNRLIYQTRQQQRSIENTIRKYKRKEAAALNKDERSRYKRFVSKWQEKQRELIDNNPFLRRRYALEQI